MNHDDFWNVLMIDDDEADYFITGEMLRHSRRGSFLLNWANTYQAGIEKIISGNYDVALIDYNLGARSGVELIQEAVAQGCRIPFLLMTGYGNYEIDMLAMQAGAVDYLVKSDLNADILERSIRYAIDRKRSETQLADANLKLAQAYEELNHERLRLNALFQYAPSAILMTDREGKIIYINPAAEQLLNFKVMSDGLQPEGGFTLHHLDGSPFPPDELPLNRSIRSGVAIDSVELLVRFNSGREVIVLKNSGPILNDSGRVTGAVAVMQDVTKHYRAEQNVRFIADLGEKLLSLDDPEVLLDQAVHSIATYLNVDCCILDEVDQEHKTVTMLGEYHRDLPAARGTYPMTEWHQMIEKRMKRGAPIVVADVPLHPAAGPLDEAGSQAGRFRSLLAIPRVRGGHWVGTLTVACSSQRNWADDETAFLKQASDLLWQAAENASLHQSLKEAQNRLEVALRNTEITVYTTDLDMRYTWIYNPPPNIVTGNIIGRRDVDVLDNERFHEVIELKRKVLDSGKGIRKEVRLELENGPAFYDLTIEPMPGAAGELTGLIVATQDITRRLQMEDQVRETTENIKIQREILKHREDERQQIARNLHDGPIQDLISLLFSIQTAMTLSQEQEMNEVLVSIREDTQKLVTELRGVCNDLRPPTLVQFGLAKAIRSHADEFQEKHKEIQVKLDLTEDRLTIPDDARLALYRVYQESLNNVVRHAQASEVQVKLVIENGLVKMGIRDNGVGFKKPTDWLNLIRQGHLGLVGIKERVDSVQGKLEITSLAGQGTLVSITVPIAETQASTN